jgi:hypothetical protein
LAFSRSARLLAQHEVQRLHHAGQFRVGQLAFLVGEPKSLK